MKRESGSRIAARFWSNQSGDVARNQAQLRQKESAGARIRGTGAYASSFLEWMAVGPESGCSVGPPPLLAYWTTVTARRFWVQQEISLQIATGRSLPNDLVVMRLALTPRATR